MTDPCKPLPYSVMRLGEKLNCWFDRTGISAREFARRVDASPTTVGRWRDGSRTPRLPELVRIARITGLPIDYLADDALDEPPSPNLTDDERMLIDLLRASGIPPWEVLTRMLREAHQKTVRPDQ